MKPALRRSTTLIAGSALAALALAGCTPGDAPGTSPGAIGTWHESIREQAELDGFTVYRPITEQKDATFPVVIWGNGGCATNNVEGREFLTNLAKHGFFIVAIGDADAVPEPMPDFVPPPEGEDGPPDGGVPPMDRPEAEGEEQIAAIDWVTETQDSGQRVWADASKIALMGQSCGGVQSLRAGQDKRVTSIASWNGSTGLGFSEQDVLDRLHTPTMLVHGGPDDIAYSAAMDDWAGLPDSVPAVLVENSNAGHVGLFGIDSPFADAPLPTMGEPGFNMETETVELAVHWLDFTLNDNESAGEFIFGDDSVLNGRADQGWSVETKHWE